MVTFVQAFKVLHVDSRKLVDIIRYQVMNITIT